MRTERYSLVGGRSEKDVYDLAVLKAREVYRLEDNLAKVEPRVDWEMLAKTLGEKIRGTYTRPSLNDGVLSIAASMFEAGDSNSLVAKRFGVDSSTASRWRKKTRSN